MNDKPPYRKWAGVVLGFLLHGSAHFLSGKRAAGFKWYFGLFGCGLAATAFLAAPGRSPIAEAPSHIIYLAYDLPNAPPALAGGLSSSSSSRHRVPRPAGRRRVLD